MLSPQVQADVGPRGGPGDVPTPFITDHKLELAEGETYDLVGRFVVRDGNLWFHVDLAEQPWLANQKRKEFPYYRVSGTRVDLEPLVVRAEKVRTKVRADGLILDRTEGLVYRIGLEVLEQPVLPSAAGVFPGLGSCSCSCTGVPNPAMQGSAVRR